MQANESVRDSLIMGDVTRASYYQARMGYEGYCGQPLPDDLLDSARDWIANHPKQYRRMVAEAGIVLAHSDRGE